MASKEDNQIVANFRDWACSFSGCDGGDPEAPIWVCGIEWGYGKERGQTDDEYEAALKKYYSKGLPEEIANGEVKPDDKYDWEKGNKYTYNQSVAKLYLAINDKPVGEYYRIHEVLKNPSLFKLNLYPIAFRYADDSLWKKYRIAEVTGLQSKETYRTWCFLNRFPEISKLVPKHDPKLIVGTGITYLVDFFACFAGVYGSGNIYVEQVGPEGKGAKRSRRIYWSVINSGKTILAVVPFFSGQYGLNSNDLLQQVGTRLGKLCQSQLTSAAGIGDVIGAEPKS